LAGFKNRTFFIFIIVSIAEFSIKKFNDAVKEPEVDVFIDSHGGGGGGEFSYKNAIKHEKGAP
jgi:hypothetical protein